MRCCVIIQCVSQVNGLVNSLLWLSKAAVQNRQGADDKVCVWVGGWVGG